MYHISQILFIVLANKQQIFPMQVVETVTKKTLKGEEVKYCLQASSDKTTKIMLDQIDGEVFFSAEEARITLIARATSQINSLITNAEKKAKIWYTTPESEISKTDTQPFISQIKESQICSLEEDDDHQEESTVILPDGQVAKIRMPIEINAK